MAETKPTGKRSSYRVIAVGVAYTDPTTVVADDGSKRDVGIRRDAFAGQTIELVSAEAERLKELGAVVDADAPATYGEMTVPELKDEADKRGLEVDGTGANGNVLQEDYVLALKADDEANATP